jgi:uncharacterized protein YdaU (DUF1376 family)
MHYYKFNIADWHLATSHLSLEEEAVYFKLINYYYDSEQCIPEETQSVIRRLRLGNHEETVGLILAEFFDFRDGYWHHSRCDEVIENYHKKADTNKKVGKLGGRPKKINDLDNNPQITQTVSENNPQITLTTNHKPITNISTPDGVSSDLWSDFIAYRKRLKAPVTNRVVTRLIKESKDANMTLEQAIETMIFKGWRSFDATWITKEVKPKQAWE